MVSFSCEVCGDVLTKKKLDPHRNRCYGASFTCIDCMVHFVGTDYRTHTSCVTEKQKYQGALYQNKKAKTNSYANKRLNKSNNNNNNINTRAPNHAFSQPHNTTTFTDVNGNTNNFDFSNRGNSSSSVTFGGAGSSNNNNYKNSATPRTTKTRKMATSHSSLQPYVEDLPSEMEQWRDYNNDSDDGHSELDHIPEAPTPPPPPAEAGNVNVFDFLVAGGTPNLSKVNLIAPDPTAPPMSQDLVRYEGEANGFNEGFDDMDRMDTYGDNALGVANFQTPAPKATRTTKKTGSDKDAKYKKRKRMHIDTDHAMVDAPPLLHTSLTGRLDRMFTNDAPADTVSPTPNQLQVAPIRKAKAPAAKPEKTHRSSSFNLKSFITGSPKQKKPKTKPLSKSKSSSDKKTRQSSSGSAKKSHSSKTKALEGHHVPKLLEDRSGSKDGGSAENKHQMVVYSPRGNLFMSYINKGPESERGCSMNKALKRYHRELTRASTDTLSRGEEEKELWRTLRLKRNDRGEIVLFTL